MQPLFKSIIRQSVQILLSPLEKKLFQQKTSCLNSPPIFIIGAPRSGTSLLYELLVTHYEFAYFTNLANTFPKTPLAISTLGHYFKTHWQGQQSSNLGYVQGFGAPSEAGSLWDRWMPEFGYLDETDLAFKKALLIEATQTLKQLQMIQNAPFINKNVMHSVHILFLNAAFPGCLFIELQRNIKANIRSIVRVREQEAGPAPDVDNWWSVRPRDVDDWCGRSFAEQACAQIIKLREDIESAFSVIGENRRIVVEYEEMCQNPEVTFEKIAPFLQPTVGKLIRRSSIFAPINPSPSKLFDEETEIRIQKTLDHLGTQHGL